MSKISNSINDLQYRDYEYIRNGVCFDQWDKICLKNWPMDLRI